MLIKNEIAKNPFIWNGMNVPNIDENEADIVVFGIPYDKGVSYRSGAADTPDILRKNTITSPPVTEYMELMDKIKVCDLGNFIDPDRDILFSEISDRVSSLVRQGIFFSAIGGDHSITIPIESGVNDALDEDFGIIHIDAHSDLSEEMNGDRFSHGSVQKRATDLEHVQSDNLFFIGIRSFEVDEVEFLNSNSTNMLTAYECDKIGIDKVSEQVINTMKKFKNIYLTVDIDSLDPAYAAGTGTPQFGGLTSRQLLTLLRNIFEKLNIIAFDVVEIAPSLDESWTSLYAGRKILTECWGHRMRKLGKL